MPTAPNATGYFYWVSTAGSGTIGTTEPVWPTVPGQTTLPDSNGVVWTCIDNVNAIYATLPPANTQALPNPVGSKTKMNYDSTLGDGAGGVFEGEFGIIWMTPRVGLTQP
jgi:hypothetical protein